MGILDRTRRGWDFVYRLAAVRLVMMRKLLWSPFTGWTSGIKVSLYDKVLTMSTRTFYTIRVIIATAILLLSSKANCLSEEIVIVTGEFPPLYTEHTKTHGVVLQIVKEVFSAVDIQVEFMFIPWARADQYAKVGGADASCCWFEQDERKKYGYYSDPIFSYSYSFFYLKSTAFDWANVADLRGIVIGATRGYTYTKEFTEAENNKILTVHRATSDIQNLKKLLYGRVQIFPLNTDVGYYLMKKEFSPEDAALITHHPKPLFKKPIHLVFPKNAEQSTRLRSLFNKGLKFILNNGRYSQIVKEYDLAE